MLNMRAEAMSLTVWLEAGEAAAQRTGGKGASLISLCRGGFPVPPGFVVVAEGYEQFVAHNGLDAAIDAITATPDLRLPKVAREVCAPLEERLAAAQLPPDLAAAITAAYRELRRRGSSEVAVRSSAISEDAAAASSAGVYETYLNLSDEAAVLDAVRRCYASLWAPRAVQYRAFKGLHGHGEAMAVVVMTLVPARTAGVAFTANPLTGDRGQIMVNASWGLGESVVSGRVTPDSFLLAKDSLSVLSREINEKQIEIVPDPQGTPGTVERPVESARAKAPTLSDHELRTLGDLCRAIEGHYGRPMDIEWAFAHDTVYVLQARPITGLE